MDSKLAFLETKAQQIMDASGANRITANMLGEMFIGIIDYLQSLVASGDVRVAEGVKLEGDANGDVSVMSDGSKTLWDARHTHSVQDINFLMERLDTLATLERVRELEMKLDEKANITDVENGYVSKHTTNGQTVESDVAFDRSVSIGGFVITTNGGELRVNGKRVILED